MALAGDALERASAPREEEARTEEFIFVFLKKTNEKSESLFLLSPSFFSEHRSCSRGSFSTTKNHPLLHGEHSADAASFSSWIRCELNQHLF